MITHIFNDQKKFSKGYFSYLKDHGADLQKHQLIHYGEKDDFFEKELGIQSFFIRSFVSIVGHFKMISLLKKSDEILVHSLASPVFLLYLWLFPEIGEKTVWLLWGKDLYFYKSLNRPKFYHKAYEFLRKKAIPNIMYITTFCKEEFNLLANWYKVNGKNIVIDVFYPRAMEEMEPSDKTSSSPFNIWLGNSASVTNNHIEAIEALKTHKKNIKRIYCPLSYGGNTAYTSKVIALGQEFFGDVFHPIIDFIPKNEYFDMMKNIDIGFFANKRQEGIGNIYSQIIGEKTIYLNMENITSNFFLSKDIEFINIETLKTEGLKVLNEAQLAKNREKILYLKDEKRNIETWKQIFALVEVKK